MKSCAVFYCDPPVAPTAIAWPRTLEQRTPNSPREPVIGRSPDVVVFDLGPPYTEASRPHVSVRLRNELKQLYVRTAESVRQGFGEAVPPRCRRACCTRNRPSHRPMVAA